MIEPNGIYIETDVRKSLEVDRKMIQGTMQMDAHKFGWEEGKCISGNANKRHR